MKSPASWFSLALGLLLATTSCQHIDVTPAGDPNRVLTGTINCRTGLPAGAELVVRVVDVSPLNTARPISANNTIAVAGGLDKPPPVERVLGEQVIVLEAGTAEPVPFKVEYHADDALLRRGLNVDARISFGGRVRYRTLDAHMITLTSSQFRQEVMVDPVR